jgi:Tol biopolymer transport system component
MRLLLLLSLATLGATALTEPARFEPVAADVLSRVTVGDHTIVYTVRRVETWQLIGHARKDDWTGPPQMLATAPSGLVVMNPALSPDGRRLFFESNVRRPPVAGRDDSDLWVMYRGGTEWSIPEPVGAPFATEYNEHSPSVDSTGLLCFNSARPGGRGQNDIYCGATGSQTPPQLVAAVSSPSQDASPWLSASGDLLLLASNRPGGLGGWDLYVARKSSNGWSRPRNLGAPVNTPGNETGPTLSPSGDRLFFLRNRGSGPTAYSTPFSIAQ